MQAIILAAGMGKRLKDLTKDNTKCMVRVNGTTLIERMLRQLDSHGLNRIVIVIGYKGQELKDYVKSLDIGTRIEFIYNDVYETTNNIHSLALAQEQLCEDDTLLVESDIIVEDDVIELLLKDPRPSLALVDKYESWMDGTCVKLSPDDVIEEFVPGSKFKFEDADSYYKTVNIYKFSKKFSTETYVPFLNAYTKAFGDNEYYEQVLRVVTNLDDSELKAMKLKGQKWYEIDDIQDLDIASSIFTSDPGEHSELMARRLGGYWRYPHLIDFTNPVNSEYPSQRMMDEFKANFEKLMTQRPSGPEVESLLAAKRFNIHPDQVIVGNGSIEFLKLILENSEGRTGLIRPSIPEKAVVVPEPVFYNTPLPDYRYTADGLISFFKDKELKRLVLMNPDCPTGNYIAKEDVKRLLQWCEDSSIELIIDESLVDLTDDNGSLIERDFIEHHKKLIIVKNISEAYGAPGLCLGVLVSGDTDLVKDLKIRVPIWNMNSFAEFYLQIEEKYRKNHLASLPSLRKEWKRLHEGLESIDGLHVIPSNVDFFMVEISGGISSSDLVSRLLEDQILIRDMSHEMDGKNIVWIGVRNSEDNDRLLSALSKIMSHT